MYLNGCPLGVRTLPPDCDPDLHHFTFYSIPQATINLIHNARIEEATDILTPGNITIVLMARGIFLGEHISLEHD